MNQLPTNSKLSLEDMLEFLNVDILIRQDYVIVELEYFDPEFPEFIDSYVAYFDLYEFTYLSTYLDIITAAIKRADFQPIDNENNEDYEEFI